MKVSAGCDINFVAMQTYLLVNVAKKLKTNFPNV